MSTLTLLPDSAPFTEEQRAWLNGFLSGFIGIQDSPRSAHAAAAPHMSPATLARAGVAPIGQEMSGGLEEPEEDWNDAVWHDASLSLDERMELAKEKPPAAQLMAAMAQLDCGSCGYVCQSYAAALAGGTEKNLGLCSPGGKATKQAIKRVLHDIAPPSSKSEQAATGLSNNSGSPTDKSQNNGETAGRWSRQNPYSAKLIEARPLNKAGSAKDTRHVVIDLTDSGLKYEAGDALGVYPTNCPELVAAIVSSLSAESRTTVATPAGNRKPLELALFEDYCLREPSDELLELLFQRIVAAEPKQQLQQFLSQGAPAGLDVLDALQLAAGATITATEFVETLSPLAPRLYSIASSMRQVGQQVHLTVGKINYDLNGRKRHGVASTLLSERLVVGQSLRVFVHSNHTGFTVPADDTAPMIMVGPGTGIAPFMAFLQERQVRQATGRNWMFFGEQHAACDFLYEEQLKSYQSSGLLTHVDTAFSRDGEGKVYVQDRMRERSAEIWKWLQQGAHFYVCGDAASMAKDVDRTLRDIVASQSKLSEAECQQFMQELIRSRRYVRDVY